MRELDAIFDRMDAHFDRIEVLIQAIHDHLNCRQQDVPLDQRGFGVTDDAKDDA
jgi:hypothetical protein